MGLIRRTLSVQSQSLSGIRVLNLSRCPSRTDVFLRLTGSQKNDQRQEEQELSAPRMAAIRPLERMWVTRSAFTQLMMPVYVCYLEQRGDLGVSGAAIHPDHVSHPPVAAVLNDHRHACPDIRKTGSALGAATPLAWSTDILPLQVRLYYFGLRDEVKGVAPFIWRGEDGLTDGSQIGFLQLPKLLWLFLLIICKTSSQYRLVFLRMILMNW